jgi:hypothetical protein
LYAQPALHHSNTPSLCAVYPAGWKVKYWLTLLILSILFYFISLRE